MTNRDRDSIAKLLLTVAERLRAAPAQAETASFAAMARGSVTNQCAHEAGALAQVCLNEHGAITRLVAEYLTPKPRQPRGARGRR